MFAIFKIDSYSYDKIVIRDDVHIIGSFSDTQKELKTLLKQLMREYKKKIFDIEETDESFTIFFKAYKNSHRRMFVAHIIKVTM